MTKAKSDPKRVPLDAISEGEFQSWILEYISWMPDLLVYHVYDSRRSNPGFPDLVIAGRKGVLWRELKKQRGKVAKTQHQWLDTLTKSGQDAGVWRPSDWPKTIMREIGAIR